MGKNKKRDKDPSKKIISENKKTGTVIFIAMIILMVSVSALSIFLVIRNKNRNEAALEEADISDILESMQDEEKPVTIYGDENSEDFDFYGEYFDSAGMKTSLTITENRGSEYDTGILYGSDREPNEYKINIKSEEDEYTVSSWDMTAHYDKDRRALIFNDCTKMKYMVLADDPEGKPVFIEEYENGSGAIYQIAGNIFWDDENEDKGAGMLFTERKAE